MLVVNKDSFPVVPAKAGTHNHREWFGEDWSFGIVIAPYREITRYGSRLSPGRRIIVGYQ
ncbi:hypothetical protein XI08_04450 [Bradyrhizobium sp. CCBAU 11361]|nr:hypothetical protein [Bradyrhizobium sp. CCBAU 11361]